MVRIFGFAAFLLPAIATLSVSAQIPVRQAPADRPTTTRELPAPRPAQESGLFNGALEVPSSNRVSPAVFFGETRSKLLSLFAAIFLAALILGYWVYKTAHQEARNSTFRARTRRPMRERVQKLGRPVVGRLSRKPFTEERPRESGSSRRFGR